MHIGPWILASLLLLAAEPPDLSWLPSEEESLGRDVDLRALAHSPRSGAPSLGPREALVTVVLFEDYQCPVCRRTTHPVKQLVADFPGEVRVVVRQNPLAMHRDAMPAAIAALAAQRQGKFWPYRDRLFTAGGRLGEDVLVRAARGVGLDLDRWRKDREDPALARRAVEERSFAEKLEAAPTPSLFVNGVRQIGWGSYGGLKSFVEREIGPSRRLVEEGTPLRKVHAARIRANSGEKGEEWVRILDAR